MTHQESDIDRTVRELHSMAAVYERRGQLDKAQELQNLAEHLQLRSGNFSQEQGKEAAGER